jgi:uncharacterized protein
MLHNTAHRPWPMPTTPWVMHMRWCDLLFAHWPVPASSLRPFIPKGLELQTFGGMAWIGVVPFRMENVRPRLVPPVPGLSAFPELNVRTYVTAEGMEGVWFFSLEAGQPIAVRIARALFHLPYMDANMGCVDTGRAIVYSSRRTHKGELPAQFEGRYGLSGAIYQSQKGSLEHWLTERYCLYSADGKGQIWRGHIHHQPWPLQSAWAEIEGNSMTGPLGLELPNQQPLLHFIRSIEVVGWWIEPVGLG